MPQDLMQKMTQKLYEKLLKDLELMRRLSLILWAIEVMLKG
jgi:hypothetical protein